MAHRYGRLVACPSPGLYSIEIVIKEPVLIHDDFQCEFYFIRHGESESNATPGIAVGANFDAPLTEKGLDQARLVGQRLAKDGVQFDRVYSSSLVRAVQTAETMLEEMGQSGRPFSRVEALMEQQMPGWRGMSVEEVFTPETRAYMAAKGMDFVPPQGESLRVVQRRVSSWIEDEFIYNQELVGTERSLKVAVVGHGHQVSLSLHHGLRPALHRPHRHGQLQHLAVPLRPRRVVRHLHQRQLSPQREQQGRCPGS